MGTLYVVATPIGNLEDITLRALRILGEVPLIVAEDTRTTRKLLSHHSIATPKLLSYTERNRDARTKAVLEALDEGNAALVSEAGTPAISDPGTHLVAAATEAGHVVEPVPGPSALTAALAASGLPTRRFHYLGFLPRAAAQRRKLLTEVAGIQETLVAFEAPHRLQPSLRDTLKALGDRRIAVCRELTKRYEETFRGSISEAIAHFAQPRGEFTLVVAGAEEGIPKREATIDIDAELRSLRAEGKRAREAVRLVVERSGRSRQEVYKRWLALDG